ncbi:pseudaminic acid synthase [Desulfomonile tiedjei]|uniref:Pseudaminic acid synthase n=1 Tax=Desulfomonile tiedjei (strain ATCC 49306 / DSM 6799 / DCB-1) TaxID=706587 RepID=I4C4C9_DESTA|nr:pseudaminic acid synthase [Desulfomonile tiedjei]AFM24420.1 pseudaminic acid synthase [Desulfomonile tiedjei DSM 6799]
MYHLNVNDRSIGTDRQVFIVAELSANHCGSLDTALRLIEEARKAGADAVKVQTYSPDTMTIDSNKDYFQIKGTSWEGRSLYDLYGEACTPWEWHPQLKRCAEEMGLVFFSTPFDLTAVDFLEKLNVPCYKVASFELVDHPLLAGIAATGKPVFMSTGMATLAEIDEAVRVLRAAGNVQMALLKCTSAYPAPPEEMNLRTIPHLAEAFHVPVGLSDHSLELAPPVTAVALGASIIEKHFTLSRNLGGADRAFSLEPHEFKAMVDAVQTAEKALGRISYDVNGKELESRVFRRSLFVVEDMKAGDTFTEQNVRSIRPAHGLAPKYLPEILGRRAATDLERGTPLGWNVVI